MESLPEKVRSIVDFPHPKTVSELRRFSGILNYYRRFLPNAASEQARLTEFQKGNKKRDKTEIAWYDRINLFNCISQNYRYNICWLILQLFIYKYASRTHYLCIYIARKHLIQKHVLFK